MNFKPNPPHALSDIEDALDKQNVITSKAFDEFARLRAYKDHIEGTIVDHTEGKSQAEKISRAKATQEWLDLHVKLNRAEAIYKFQQREYDNLQRKWQSQYLMHKLDGQIIKKPPQSP